MKQTKQDSDPSGIERAKARTDQKFHTHFKRNLVIGELVPVLLVLFLPLSVQAGFFASLLEVFKHTAEAEMVQNEAASFAATDTPLLSARTNPNPAVGGGDIAVSDGALVSMGPVGEDEIAESNYRSGEIRVFTVGEGDTLSQIAEMYGVTTNTILWANDLDSASDIHPGDTLVILPIVGVQHEVAAGETLQDIIDKYEANFEEVIAYNNLASADDIAEGDELMIPGGEIAMAQKITYAEPTSTSGGSSGSNVGFTHPAPGAVRTQGIHGYNGVDLAAGYGSAIRAAAAGEVIVSKSGGWNGGYGNYIVIKHRNGTQTLYAHLSSNSVGAGAWVSVGQTIGAMGNSGRSTGTHLHFEVRGAKNPF